MLQRNNGGYVAYLEYFPPCLNRGNGTTPRRPRTSTGSFSFAFPSTPRFFPDAVPVLKEPAPSWIPAGNHQQRPFRTAEPQAVVSGVRPYMDIAVVSGDEQVHKPDPEIFRRTAARLGIPCSCCVYVGDHPVNDVQGSLSAGMKPVYINPFYTPVHPQGVPEIHTLTELLNLLPGQSELPE